MTIHKAASNHLMRTVVMNSLPSLIEASKGLAAAARQASASMADFVETYDRLPEGIKRQLRE